MITAAGPIRETWPSPADLEQTRADPTAECPFTPRIVVHQIKGDRLARKLATKPASRSRLAYLASPGHGGPPPTTSSPAGGSNGLPQGTISPQVDSARRQRQRQRNRPSFLKEAEAKAAARWTATMEAEMEGAPSMSPRELAIDRLNNKDT